MLYSGTQVEFFRQHERQMNECQPEGLTQQLLARFWMSAVHGRALQIFMQKFSHCAVNSIFDDVHPLSRNYVRHLLLETVVSLSHFLIVEEDREGKPFSRILLFSL